MTLQAAIAFLFTVLSSVCLVAVIILFGWVLIWKAYLSKFRLVRELLGQENVAAPSPPPESSPQGDRGQPPTKAKKTRKD